jgi:hypothetical protein
MIYIDYQGGAHGNFLEFTCNKFLAGVDSGDLPFNVFGASHDKNYAGRKVFEAGHYFQYNKVPLTNAKIISIRITEEDLLPLSNISLLRAGDLNLDNDSLEVDTYNKLDNIHYRWVLDNIIEKFSANQIRKSYEAVKDPSWPIVNGLDDFQKLPNWIKSECLEQHNCHLIEISNQNPDCPRWVLREFFKLGFKNPKQAGFFTQQDKMDYDTSNDVFYFPFGSFYDLEWFKKEVFAISVWANLDYRDPTALHKEFMKRQPYAHDKKFCDDILARIYSKEKFVFPKLDLMKESYLEAALELYYDYEFPFYQPVWFKTSDEILSLATAKQ